MSFSTKGIDTTPKDTTSKSLELGNHMVRVYSAELVEMSYDNPNSSQRDANIILTLVGKSAENFVGWPIDKDNPSKGNHQGPIARVSISQYNFSNKTLPNGVELKRDPQILYSIASLADELEVRDLIDEITADTIEDYVAAASQAFKRSKVKLNVLIGGRQYLNGEGKIRYNYYLPKVQSGKKAYQNAFAETSIVPDFNQEEHVYIPEKVKQATVTVSQPVAKQEQTDDIDW